MIKLRRLWLGLALAFLSSAALFGQSSGDARAVIVELIESNANLENRLIELTEELNARDERLTKLSKLLETIKSENENLQNEIKLQLNLSKIAAELAKQRENSLKKTEIERTVFMIGAGVLGVGWGLDRLIGR